jgi:hypothetical protein
MKQAEQHEEDQRLHGDTTDGAQYNSSRELKRSCRQSESDSKDGYTGGRSAYHFEATYDVARNVETN